MSEIVTPGRPPANGASRAAGAALLVLIGLWGPGVGAAQHVAEPPVALASSLRFAWPAIEAAAAGRAREGDGPVPVRTTFGASLALAGQMLAGAPFELLVAADTESVARLVAGGRVDPADVARYADGRLALAVRTDSPLAPRPSLGALVALLEDAPAARIAIANPATAPYGRAALEALASVGLAGLSPARVARGESAGQALQYLLSGAVDAALVPHSLVRGAPPGTDAVAALVDAAGHAPIEHSLGLVRNAGPAARSLAAFLGSCAARPVLEREGFAAPAGVACSDAPDPR